MSLNHLIKLNEYETMVIERDEFSNEAARVLWPEYKDQIKIEPPSFLTGGKWRLKSQGWIGHIPVNDDLSIRLLPKRGITITNLFRMLEYAYRLEIFKPLEGLTECNTLEDLYERLANILARRVLDRSSRGFYSAYQPQSGQIPFVRGQIDMNRTCMRPWEVNPVCNFEEHTADLEENQILAWTLLQILCSGICTDRSLPFVRQAYCRLLGFAGPRQFDAQDCIGRLYNRLNNDYEPMHILCWFFLTHQGPGHEIGDRKMIPFLVDMESLFELFVAEWVIAYILACMPDELSIKSQEPVPIDPRQGTRFIIDLVLYDNISHKPLCVLDTKYKVGAPSTSDIAQIIAYAEAKGCYNAFLVYPTELASPLDIVIGDIHIKTIAFSLNGDLDKNGRKLMDQILNFTEGTSYLYIEDG